MKMLILIAIFSSFENHMYALRVAKTQKPLWNGESEDTHEYIQYNMEKIEENGMLGLFGEKCCEKDVRSLKETKPKVLNVDGLSVAFLGCSVDKKMVHYYHWCQRNTDERCKMSVSKDNGPKFEYFFIPGVTTPYWGLADHDPASRPLLKQNGSYAVVDAAAHRFVTPPALLIVSSDLWDFAAWWQHARYPRPPYNYKHDLEKWVNTDVPNFMQYVKQKFPESKIVFRTAPVTGGDTKYGASPQLMEEMYDIVRSKTSPDGKFLGQFDLLDYHSMVDKLIQHESRYAVFYNPRGYVDPIHPNDQGSHKYMERVFEILRGLDTKSQLM